MARLPFLVMLTALLGAAFSSCEGTTGYQQMITYVKRHPGLSREQFWDYWQTQHAPKVAPIAQHVGITRYQQVCRSPSHFAASWGQRGFYSRQRKDVSAVRHIPANSAPQVQVGGNIPVTAANVTAPENPEMVEFDGIAMFLYQKPENLEALTAHPYYTDVIAPDEAKFIDKSAFNGGQVATYIGKNVEVVEDLQNVWVGDAKLRDEYQKKFDEYNQ